ncbi:MAG: lipoyl(octanoyl) transferase LipB [Candidatus Limnocylindrales bacterium]
MRTVASAGIGALEMRWLGQVAYREAWAQQHALVEARAAGQIPDQLLLLEHPAVLTLGRHADAGFVRAEASVLAARGIEVIRTERGGEVTYHGPGQLVAYPIVHLADRGLLIRPFVRVLEAAMRETCAAFGVAADRRDGYPGCWVEGAGPAPRKIGALGVRVEHGVSYHGIALNVTVALADFELIEACGLPGVIVTSIVRERPAVASEMGWPSGPSTGSVAAAATVFGACLERALRAARADPAAADRRPASASAA